MVIMLKQCGCGCTLKTGTIVIGVLQAVTGFSIMVSESLASYKAGKITMLSSHNPELTPEEEETVNDYVASRNELCIVLAIAGAIQLFLSILLLYGADYESPKLVKPWVVFSMIMAIVMIGIYLGFAILTFTIGFDALGLRILLGMILASGISSYFLLVVYSFYRTLVLQSEPCKI